MLERTKEAAVNVRLRAAAELPVLNSGSCEPLKAVVHATALGLSVLMGLYNAAAWLRRREMHLAINAGLYSCLSIWEQRHVAHHLDACRRKSRLNADAKPLALPEERVA